MSEHDGNPLVVELQTLRTEALARLDHITDLTALDTWRIDYLGRRGALTQVMRGIGQLPAAQRPQVGQVSNEVKTALEEAFEARVTALKQAQLVSTLAQQRIDVTLPGVPVSLGRCIPARRRCARLRRSLATWGFRSSTAARSRAICTILHC